MSAKTTGREIVGGFDSLAAIQAANRDLGHYFFDGPTMRYFGTRLSRAYGVRGVLGGRFFVTTERRSFGLDEPRRASIRMALDNGECMTVGKFVGYHTAAQAVKALRAALGVGVRVEECGDGSCGVFVGELPVGATPYLSRHRARQIAAQIRRTSGARRARCPAGYMGRAGEARQTYVVSAGALRDLLPHGISPACTIVEVEALGGLDGTGTTAVIFHDTDRETSRHVIPLAAVEIGTAETGRGRRREAWGLPPRAGVKP